MPNPQLHAVWHLLTAISSHFGTPLSDQIGMFNHLELYHKPPDSGERQYKAKIETRRFDPALWWHGLHLHNLRQNFPATSVHPADP